MSTDDRNKSFPKSMRHKQILDIADENPDAAIDELASEVPSATPDLVERVLEKHGDPAAEETMSPDSADSSSHGSTVESDGSETIDTPASVDGSEGDETGDHPTTDDDAVEGTIEAGEFPAVDELSEKHRKLIQVIAKRPEATQAELADQFDVTRATVSRWANEIEGFEWSDRESFVAVVDSDPVHGESTTNPEETDTTVSSGEDGTESVESETEVDGREITRAIAELRADVDRLTDRIETLEESIEAKSTSEDSVLEDPDLVHKLVHACMDSETLSESEELRILRELLE